MKIRRLVSLALACAMLLSGYALADYEFDASVVCTQPDYVTAAIGGVVGEVPAMAGQLVTAGDVLVRLKTQKVYAPVNGTVTGIFCDAGDSISSVTERYGALVSIEPDNQYTLTASTDYAYNASANKYVHVGETVFLLSSDGAYTGGGTITSVSGTDFTVVSNYGTFYIGNTVYVYRDASHTAKTRIGRGSIARADNVGVTGSAEGGSVVSLHVTAGQYVRAGDLLLETLSGEYDASYCTGSELTCDADGILGSLNANVGATINKGDVIAALYPRDRLQLKAEINESDLAVLPEGTPVEIRFTWNEDTDEAAAVSGTVSRVLYTANESSGDGESGISASASYTAYIDFDAGEEIRMGMTAIIRPANGDADAPDAETIDEDIVEASSDGFDAPDSDAPDGSRDKSFPKGFNPSDGELPEGINPPDADA